MAKVTIDTSRVLARLSAPGQPLDRGMRRAATRVVNQAKRELTTGANRAVDTGRLRSSITYDLRRDGNRLVARIGTDVAYSIHVHRGHGIIRPKRAKVLRFPAGRGSSGFVFAQQVRAVDPKPFLTDALRILTVSDFRG